MILLDIITALIVAIILSAFFSLSTRRRGRRSGLIWLFLILFLATWAGGIWLRPFGVDRPAPISYSGFKDYIRQGNVQEITVKGDEISGVFKQPLKMKNKEGKIPENAPSFKHFRTVVPSFGDSAIMEMLEQEGATVNAETDERSWLSNLLIGLLPWVLIDEILDAVTEMPQEERKAARRLLMNGHEAVGLGAISAGVKFCAFYPMSPSTSVPQALIDWSERMGLIVEQAEDGHMTEDLFIRPVMVRKRLKKLDGMAEEVVPVEFQGSKKPEILLVSWGSSKGAVAEACERLKSDGRKVGNLHFSQLWPLNPDQFMKYLESSERVVCVEGNATGQLARLIRQETGSWVPCGTGAFHLWMCCSLASPSTGSTPFSGIRSGASPCPLTMIRRTGKRRFELRISGGMKFPWA